MAKDKLDHRYFSILVDLGMSIPIEEQEIEEVKATVGANLPALPTTVAAANRIIADTLDVAAIVDNDPNREAARARMRARLVREANGQPHVANIVFEGEENPKKNDIHVKAIVELPGIGKVRVVPLIHLDVNYLLPISEHKYRSAGTFQCLVLKPLRGRSAYKAIPLGVADESTISTWNRIAREMTNRNWPQIQVIKNNLRRHGVRRMTFRPTCDPNIQREKGSRKRILLGELFGQKLFLSSRSQIPEPDLIDGIKRFERKHEFRVKISEGSLELTWLGFEGDIKFENRLAILDVHEEIDPFKVLGTSALKVDQFTIGQTARGYLNRPYDEKNPLYASALALNLVFERDPLQTKRVILEDLMLKAIEQVKIQFEDSLGIVLQSLEIAPLRPSLQEVLGGRDQVSPILYRKLNVPVDAAAVWIERVLDCRFDPKSPFHMQVRSWLINQIEANAKKDSLTAKPPQLPAPTDEHAVLVALDPKDVVEVSPIEEIVDAMPPRHAYSAVLTEKPEETADPNARTHEFLDEFRETGGTVQDQEEELPKSIKPGFWFNPGAWKDTY